MGTRFRITHRDRTIRRARYRRTALGFAPLALTLALAVTSVPGRAAPLAGRAVVFEPCAELFGSPLADQALEEIAGEQAFVVERVEPHGDVQAWLALLADPPAVLYLHTATNREAVAVACFADRRARDLALEELASAPVTRGLPVQPWHYATNEREVFLIAYELGAIAQKLRDTETIVYFHREGDPRAVLDAKGVRVSRAHETPQPAVNHFVFGKRFFRQWLVAPDEPVAVENTGPRPPWAPVPDIWLWPEKTSVVLPIGEVWITLRNVGSAVLADLSFETVSSPSELHVRAIGRLPPVLPPGAEIDVPLMVETHRQLPDDVYLVPYLFRAELDDTRTYEKYGQLEVVVDHPPQITAPSSVEFVRGESVEILARDPARRPVHLEAMLPLGVDLQPTGNGSARLDFSLADIPGAARVTVTLVAWAGDDRHTARLGLHEIEIVGGDIRPPPWIVYGAYGALLLAIGLGYLYARFVIRRA